MELKKDAGPRRRMAIIVGSVRPDNYSMKAARPVMDEFDRSNVEVDLIDPAGMDLPMPGLKPETEKSKNDTARLREVVQRASGVVIATPEYHGSFSSVTKLLIENMGFPSALAGKPVALMGVAAGSIGAIKSLEALRGVCSHVGAIVLPGPVSVAGIRDVFNSSGEIVDERVEKRLRGVATGLLHYIDEHVCPKFALEAMVRQPSG
jgi:NAD(P)H-dependent FMN reductase